MNGSNSSQQVGLVTCYHRSTSCSKREGSKMQLNFQHFFDAKDNIVWKKKRWISRYPSARCWLPLTAGSEEVSELPFRSKLPVQEKQVSSRVRNCPSSPSQVHCRSGKSAEVPKFAHLLPVLWVLRGSCLHSEKGSWWGKKVCVIRPVADSLFLWSGLNLLFQAFLLLKFLCDILYRSVQKWDKQSFLIQLKISFGFPSLFCIISYKFS